MYLSVYVLPSEVLSSFLRLFPFIVHCCPNSRTTYYNVSICIVLYCPLKPWVVPWDYSPLKSSIVPIQGLYLLNEFLCIVLSIPETTYFCSPRTIYLNVYFSIFGLYQVCGGVEILDKREILRYILKINGAKRQENFQLYFLSGKTPLWWWGQTLFLPRTPQFYLCPKIPGVPKGGKRTTAPPCTLPL